MLIFALLISWSVAIVVLKYLKQQLTPVSRVCIFIALYCSFFDAFSVILKYCFLYLDRSLQILVTSGFPRGSIGIALTRCKMSKCVRSFLVRSCQIWNVSVGDLKVSVNNLNTFKSVTMSYF